MTEITDPRPYQKRGMEKKLTTASLKLSPSLDQDEVPAQARRRGFWRRVYDAIVKSQMRKARREIRRYKDLMPSNEELEARYRSGETDSR